MDHTETSDWALSIGEIAERVGLKPSAIRYYERLGLIPAPEREGGRRRYGEDTVQLLNAIQASKAAGFSLKEIELLFRGFDPETSPSERWRELAQAKMEELDLLAQRLEGMRTLLQRGVECGCLSLSDCELLGAPKPS